MSLGRVEADSRTTISGEEFTRAIRAGEDRDFSRLVVEGDVDLVSIDYPRRLVARDTIFRGHFHAGEARFARAVDLTGCIFEQNLNLSGARVDGRLILRSATIRRGHGDQAYADFERVTITGTLDARLLHAETPLIFRGARVDGDTLFVGAQVEKELNLDNAQLGGELLVCATAAELGDGPLELTLLCKGEVDRRAIISGPVGLFGAKVAGFVVLDGAKLGELILQSAEVGGDVLCRAAGGHRAEVGGRAWLHSAKVAGQVVLAGAKLDGELILQSAEVGGDVFCRAAGGHRAEVDGQIWLHSAKVAGNVEFLGAKVGGDLILQAADLGGAVICRAAEPHAFELSRGANLERCRIGHLVLDGRACAGGVLNLAQAQFTELEIVEALPDRVDPEGIQFRQITLPGDDYLGFLESARPFRKSTYAFLERWLRDRGDDWRANQVYRQMRRRDRRIGLGWFARLGDWFLDVTIAYGTRSYRLFVYFLVVIGLSTWLFAAPRAVERDVVLTMQDVRQGRIAAPPVAPGPGDWSPIRAFWLALQMNIPLVSIMSSDSWGPSSERIALGSRKQPEPLTYENYAATVSALGWVLFPLFLAGISGVVKRQP